MVVAETVTVSTLVLGATVVTAKIVLSAVLAASLQILNEEVIKGRLDITAVIPRITALVDEVKLIEDLDYSERKAIQDVEYLLKAYMDLRRSDVVKKYRYKRRINKLEARLTWIAYEKGRKRRNTKW